MSRSWWLGPSSVALVAFASLEFTRCYDTRPQAGLRPCAPRTVGMRCLEQLLRRNLLPRRSLPAALAAAASSPCLGAPSRTHGGAAADSHGSAAAAAAAAAASSASPAPAAMPEADASHGWTRPGRVADVAAAPACASSAAAPPLLSALLLGGAVCAAVAAGATASDEVRRAFSFCGGASVFLVFVVGASNGGGCHVSFPALAEPPFLFSQAPPPPTRLEAAASAGARRRSGIRGVGF